LEHEPPLPIHHNVVPAPFRFLLDPGRQKGINTVLRLSMHFLVLSLKKIKNILAISLSTQRLKVKLLH
jgi:hypothetical protein